MLKRTRYFLLGSVGVLALGLGAGLLAYYAGFPSGAASLGSQAALEPLRFVPDDATIVAYANVRDVMTSQVRARFRDVDPDGAERREFEEKTGINIETDIDHVVAALMPREGTEDGLFLISGRFNETRLESLARERGGTVETYREHRLLRDWHDGRRRDRQGALAFLEPGLLAIGDETSVRRAIDRVSDGGTDITSNDEMMRLVREVSGVNTVWAVGRLDSPASREALPPQVRERIPPIQWFTAGGRLNGGVVATVRAEARDEAAATNLRDVVRGFLALARLQGGSRPELQTLLQSIELGGTGSTVAVSASVPLEVIDALAPDARRPAER